MMVAPGETLLDALPELIAQAEAAIAPAYERRELHLVELLELWSSRDLVLTADGVIWL